MRLGGDYNPAPTVEALTMMAGGGAPAARVLGEEGSVAALGLLPKVKDTFGNITTAEYKALDEAGKHVLDLNTSYNAKNKSLYVDWAGLPQSPETDKLGLDQYIKQSANAVGPKEIRSIIGALKQEYPDMQSITGIRISGARKAAEEAKPGSYVADPVLRVRK
jgi:hypothetical protein